MIMTKDRMDKFDHKKQAADFFTQVMYATNETDEPLAIKLDEMLHDDLVIQWNKFDECDPKTWPNDCEGRNTVLAFTSWSKGSHHRYGSIAAGDVMKETSEARFFEAFYGRYDVAMIDGDERVVFFLDHRGDDEGNEDDWVDPPQFWTYIADPQRLEIFLN